MFGPQAPWRLVPRPAGRWARIFTLAALAGLAGGLAAAAMEWGLVRGSELLVGRFAHLGSAQVLQFNWAVLLLPAAGGLASGLIVRALAPRATGHGTDVLVRAFHRNLGLLPLRGPLVKGGAAILVLACGGSAGPEGPIAALGAALGSTIAGLARVTPRERRILLIAGCAAGIGAIFRCPLGGALFAAAILYSQPEFESDALVPSFIASVVGYSAYMSFWGFGEHLLPDAGRLAFTTPVELLPYAVLGLVCGGVSIFFVLCFRLVSDRLLPASRLPIWLAPAVGGLATGALACLLPQVMDGRYVFVRHATDGTLFGSVPLNWWWWARLFAAIMLCKCVATAFTVGSGASGGVLGPAVFIGGTAGATVGALCEALFPGVFPEPLRRALIPVGMGGVLAATMRTPLAAIVMATEMAGSYGLLVPSMLVCTVAYVIGRPWGLNREQVSSATESPAHAGDAIVHVLESSLATRVLEADWPLVVPPNATLGEMIRKLQAGTRPVFAVVRDGRFVGLVSVPDIRRVINEAGLTDAVIAADMMTTRVAVAHPDEDLYAVLNLFRQHAYNAIPVVSRDRDRHWLGMLTRERVYETVQNHIQKLYRLVVDEHSSLAAMQQEGQIAQLLMGVEPTHRDRIQWLPVPQEVVGQSLRQAEFARRYAAQVIAIERPGGELQVPPDIDAPLRADQRLVVLSLES